MHARPLAAALAVLVLAGCGTSTPPDEQAWEKSSAQVLDDVAGSVASSRITLHEERAGHLVGRAGLVMAQDAESSASGATQGYLHRQPAPGRADDFREIAELLHEAGAVLVDARIALATGAEDEYAALQSRLLEVGEALDAAAEPLRGAGG
ncbi:MAG: hypothetical protein DCC50_01770 [Acidobacteria bacterium]|nr:MAG: hypothetical protein DCC50_01770 [Acidobacteriota bacterium]